MIYDLLCYKADCLLLIIKKNLLHCIITEHLKYLKVVKYCVLKHYVLDLVISSFLFDTASWNYVAFVCL